MVCGGSGDKAVGEAGDRERRERIQRYKEERRRQIAARYGAAEWSSEEDSTGVEGDGAEAESYRAYRRRHRETASPAHNSSQRSGSDAGIGRLPSAAAGGGGDTVNNNRDGGSGDTLSSGPLSPRILSAAAMAGDCVESGDHSPLVAAGGAAGGSRGLRQAGHGKDKTHKRMSHLNRAATSEEPVLEHRHEQEMSNEDQPRRRRRRSHQQVSSPGSVTKTDGLGPGASEPLKTPEVVRNVVSRLTPPPSPPAVYSTQTVQSSAYVPPRVPQHSTTTSPKKGVAVVSGDGNNRDNAGEVTSPSATCGIIGPVTLGNDRRSKSPITQSIINQSAKKELSSKESSPPSPSSPSVSFRIIGSRPGSLSAPSTLDYRNKSKLPASSSFDRSLETGESTSTLQRPDIPDVLRSKESSSGLVSPGMVSAPCKASSVVLDKPPTGSEVLRPTAIRSSLRKVTEIGGTCFMASKRDKKDDEIKSEHMFKDFQKNRDRWSKSDLSGDGDCSFMSAADNLSDDGISNTLDMLTERSRENIAKADRLAGNSSGFGSNGTINADNLVNECENYLDVTGDEYSRHTISRFSSRESSIPKQTSPTYVKGIMSDSSQKNGVGGSEGHGQENKRLVHQKEVKKENRVNFNVIDYRSDEDNDVDIDFLTAQPSGSPVSLAMEQEEAVLAIAGELMHGRGLSQRQRSLDGDHGDYRRVRSPEPLSILKRRHSRDDMSYDRPITPEPQGILKKSSSRGSSSRASSVGSLDGELIPILKKKSSVEELDIFAPKPILKKKSSTDDELDDRPKSILKSGRSGEDLYSGGDSGVVSPAPILKRSGRCDSDGEELRPTSILKRRDTIDGVRLRVHLSDGEECTPGARLRSDSAPETSTHRSRSPTMSGGNKLAYSHSTHSSPSHRSNCYPHQRPSILKNRWSASPSVGNQHQSEGELCFFFKSRRSADEEVTMDGNLIPNRPVSPSLLALRRDSLEGRSRTERPLCVSDRIAGMEVSYSPSENAPLHSPSGVRAKVRTPSFNNNRPLSLDSPTNGYAQDVHRRSSWSSIDRNYTVSSNCSIGDSGPLLSSLSTPSLNPNHSGALPATRESFSFTPGSALPASMTSSPIRRPRKDIQFASNLLGYYGSEDQDISRSRRLSRPTDLDESSNCRRLSVPINVDDDVEYHKFPVSEHMSDNKYRKLSRSVNLEDSSSSDDSDSVLVEAHNLDAVASDAARFLIMTSEQQQDPESPSGVAQKTAFFAQLENESKVASIGRKERALRYNTQPVTVSEVSRAALLADAAAARTVHPRGELGRRASDAAARGSYRQDGGGGYWQHGSDAGGGGGRVGDRASVGQDLDDGEPHSDYEGSDAGDDPDGGAVGRCASPRPFPRHFPPAGEDGDEAAGSVRGILKRGGSREYQDSPRSILKVSSGVYSQDHSAPAYHPTDHPTRSILRQGETATLQQCVVVAPPPMHKVALKGVLKKDSSLEDNKEIRSILKPQSDFVRHSSDSSSDDQAFGSRHTPYYASKLAGPQTEDLGAALREIESIARVEREAHHSREQGKRQGSLRSPSPTPGNIQPCTSTPALTNLNNAHLDTLNSNNGCHIPYANDTSNILDNDFGEDGRNSLSSSNTSDDSLNASNNALNALTSSPPPYGDVPQQRSSFPGVELNASQILSQSPLFRKKFTPEEKLRTSNQVSDLPNSNTSLNSRVAALHKSGDEGWRSRVHKENKDVNSNVTTRQKSGGGPKERPVSLMDRVNQLESSSQTWKGRVSLSDATKFTVAHKLAMSASASSVPNTYSPSNKTMVPVLPGVGLSRSATSQLSSSVPTSSVAVPSPPSSGGSSGVHTPTTPLGSSPPVICVSSTDESPPNERKVRKTPQPKIFKSKTGGNIPQMLPGLRPPRTDYRRAISTPAAQNTGELDSCTQTVKVFEVADEHFDSFFATSSTTQSSSALPAEEPLDLLALDHVSSSVQTLCVQRRRVQKQSRQRASVGNPVKAMASKGLTEYTETRLHAGERELRRSKVEELSKHSSLALEALAGLASKENFSAVTLKPVSSTDTRELPPYTHPMLLRVKGRRHAEARLIEPVTASVNGGDDFVLVTPTQVYHFKSEFANVIERAKASEIAAFIVQQKDLGVTSTTPVAEITENVKGVRRTRFWEVLGGDASTSIQPPSEGGDDEEVEACLARSNKVYRVEGCSLVPHQPAWGKPPTVDVLASEQVLVFDFGSEVYSWSGKRAVPEERRAAVQLARELWDESYDYGDCDMNPVRPTPDNAAMTGPRPSWGILGKLTENLETILFKDKFIDWPDTAQKTRIKEVREELSRRVDPVCSLQPCSGDQLLAHCPPDPDLLLEMTHLGRGTEYYDAEERRLLVIGTKDYRVWHITEAATTLLPPGSRCHFHASDTYVVRWYYSVTATGRTLKGAPSKHAVTGRERVAYFFWQGRDSSLSDKGASALMTVELDEERGPHIRVTMASEPPAFLNIFDGAFVVHCGRRGADHNNNGSWKMFLVRGEAENEAHILGIAVNRAHLRSRGCVLLVDLNGCVIHLWNGCKALKHTRKIASKTAKKLSESSADALGWKSSIIPRIKDQFEGAETKQFWDGIREGETLNSQTNKVDSEINKDLTERLAGIGKQSKQFGHLSLLSDTNSSYDWTPRMWRLEAKHDSFQVSEITCSYRLPLVANPMPFTMDDLYSTHIQPALFLLDAGGHIWLWQGWWPAEEEDSLTDSNANTTTTNGIVNGTNGDCTLGGHAATTGSAVLRFNFARKAALQTAINYAAALGNGCKGSPQLIVAGLEPLEFTNLFPVWQHRPDVAAIQRKGGRYTSPGQYPAEEVLQGLCRMQYTLEELQSSPTPDGVDPSRLEDYLTDTDFEVLLGVTKEQFTALQQWKQLDMKKKAKLF